MQVGRKKSRFPSSIWLHRVLSTLRPAKCYQHGATDRGKILFIADSKRRSLLMAGDDDECL